MAKNLKTWGYVLEGPRRPERSKQIEIIQAHGIDVGDYGPLWSDKIERGRRGPGSGQKQLSGRNDLLKALLPGDRVIVADVYCLGISPDDVKWFIGELTEREASLLVSGASHSIEPGGDASELLTEVARRQSAANVALHRARRTKRGRRKAADVENEKPKV